MHISFNDDVIFDTQDDNDGEKGRGRGTLKNLHYLRIKSKVSSSWKSINVNGFIKISIPTA